jgi:hypothetical protein
MLPPGIQIEIKIRSFSLQRKNIQAFRGCGIPRDQGKEQPI